MINEKYFNETNEKLINILDNSDLIPKEIRDKKQRLNGSLKDMINKQEIDNQYVSLGHEIKSYDFLKRYGDLRMARDTISNPGPDFKLNNYWIECVSCSSGDTNVNGLDNYRLDENNKSIIVDYNKLLEILLPRITQELKDKSETFRSYIDSRNYKKRRALYYIYIIR